MHAASKMGCSFRLIHHFDSKSHVKHVVNESRTYESCTMSYSDKYLFPIKLPHDPFYQGTYFTYRHMMDRDGFIVTQDCYTRIFYSFQSFSVSFPVINPCPGTNLPRPLFAISSPSSKTTSPRESVILGKMPSIPLYGVHF